MPTLHLPSAEPLLSEVLAAVDVVDTATTPVLLTALTYGAEGSFRHFFYERTVETVTGVAMAYFFGLAVPEFGEGRRNAKEASPER